MVIDTANSREEFQVKLKSADPRNVKESYLIPALKAGLIERPISQKKPIATCRNTVLLQTTNPP
jgi:hypothetical protein